MAVDWTSLGPELLVRLDRSGVQPLGMQLQQELRTAMQSGRLAFGERLPSTRELARTLDVSRGLVVDSYQQLEAEGYLTSTPGSGTHVSVHGTEPTQTHPTATSEPALRVDFAYGRPDLNSFPMKAWLWSLGEAARTVPIAQFGYGQPQGAPQLRTVLAAYLNRVRGALTNANDIVVCSGYGQGINLVLDMIARRGGRRIAVEDPGDRENDRAIRRAGMDVVPITVDDEGIDSARVVAEDVDAVVLTPAHQCPSGVVLAAHRRQQLATWAERSQRLIIEDDYDAEFRYDRQPVGSLQGLAPNHVVALGTVSKSLAPFLRLGWIVSPPRLTAEIVDGKLRADRGSPGLDQLALAALITSGKFDRHLRRMRVTYAERRTALVDSLRRHAPAVSVSGLAAGFHAVLDLPDHLVERDVLEGARQRSIGLYGMSDYRFDGVSTPPSLVLGFGNVTPATIDHAIESIGGVLT